MEFLNIRISLGMSSLQIIHRLIEPWNVLRGQKLCCTRWILSELLYLRFVIPFFHNWISLNIFLQTCKVSILLFLNFLVLSKNKSKFFALILKVGLSLEQSLDFVVFYNHGLTTEILLLEKYRFLLIRLFLFSLLLFDLNFKIYLLLKFTFVEYIILLQENRIVTLD